MQQRLKSLSFGIWLTLIYGVLLAISLYYHELWRDETEAWMIAAASKAPWDILHNSRFEGHPPLWFYIIWPFTWFSSPDWIKVPHFLLAISTCYLFGRYSPFPKWVTVLLMFGYYFFFEYGVISRDYQLGVLGIMGFCLLYPVAMRKPFVGLVFLCLAAGSHFLSLIISSVLGLYFLVDLVKKIRNEKPPRYFIGQVIISATLFVAFLVSLFLLLGFNNEGFSGDKVLYWDSTRFDTVMQLLWRALLPISKDVLAFWNTSVFNGLWVTYAGVALLLLLALAMARYAWHTAIFLLMAIGILSFQYVMYFGNIRHSGQVWLAFVAVMCLLSTRYGWSPLPKTLKSIFILILLIQGYAGVIAASKDIRYPFSGAKATYTYVKNAGWSNYHIIGNIDYVASTFVAYNKRPIYYPMCHCMGTYVQWTNTRTYLDFSAYLRQQQRELQAAADSTLILSDRTLDDLPWLKLRYDSGRSIEWSERLYVYTVNPIDSGRPQ